MRTGCPSLKRVATSTPETCARICTDCEDATRPTAWSSVGTSFSTAEATRTVTARGPAADPAALRAGGEEGEGGGGGEAEAHGDFVPSGVAAGAGSAGRSSRPVARASSARPTR